jgi:hypothetical protein
MGAAKRRRARAGDQPSTPAQTPRTAQRNLGTRSSKLHCLVLIDQRFRAEIQLEFLRGLAFHAPDPFGIRLANPPGLRKSAVHTPALKSGKVAGLKTGWTLAGAVENTHDILVDA